MDSNKIKSDQIAQDLHGVFLDLGEDSLAGASRLLAERLQKPQTYVTVCGETSTGKSSIINGLLEEKLLPAKASPTSAALVNVSLEKDAVLEFSSIQRNGDVSIIERDVFERLAVDPPKDLLRLRVRISPTKPSFDAVQVFDTPGYNSVVAEHEEVLRSFLPESDVIVFVCAYRTGFGQVDQELLELIGAATSEDPDIPVLLVINRVPNEVTIEDNRISEILNNATDCLKKRPEVYLVQSFSQRSSLVDSPSKNERVPDAEILWDRVSSIVLEPTRVNAVNEKLLNLLSSLVEEADSIALNRELVLSAKETERDSIRKNLNDLTEARKKSLALVHEMTKRLRKRLPVHIHREVSSVLKSLKSDIDASDKWLGAEDCVAWISGHALHFEARNLGKSVEMYISLELENLNRQLEEVANTCIKRIESTVRVRDKEMPDLAKKLVSDLVRKIGGDAVKSGLKNLGGVGGHAAGAGNLAKMAVKRVGALFGKKFGRGVYDQIGRLFTKRFVAKLSVAIYVLIEAVGYLRHVHVWKKKLHENVSTALDKWSIAIIEDLSAHQIPIIENHNLDGIHEIYDGLIRDIEESLNSDNKDAELNNVHQLRQRLASHRANLESTSL